jgi:hypothetical protein
MNRIALSLLVLTLFSGVVSAADPNALTEEEKRAGFELLFNGHNLRGWGPAMTPWELEDGPWKVHDGAIYFQADQPGFPSLAYQRKTIPADFDLRFQWKESPAGTSGLQGHFSIGTYGAMTETGWTGRLWCSYSAGERDINLFTDEISVPVKFAGVSMSATPCKNAKRPAGKWNEARMVCKGPLFQNWLNGEKIVEVDLRQGNWLKLEKEPGSLLLDQWMKVRTRGFCLAIDNSDVPAWYRGLKVRAIPADEAIPHDALSDASGGRRPAHLTAHGSRRQIEVERRVLAGTDGGR